MNNKFRILLLIIGYNAKAELRALLPTINFLHIPAHCSVEIIYVDDGSTDQSYDYFNNQTLLFEKKSFCYKTNQGRVAAMQKAIDLCSGEWCILTQCNVVLNNQLIIEYYNSIMKNSRALAWMGLIQYQSNDVVFTKYLNHKKRGSNQYKNNDPIHYQHLLFGNCCIHKSVLRTLRLNLDFAFYGGEELDFAYRVNIKYPNSLFMCSGAVVLRKNFPNFIKHCKRLEEYGRKNLINLSPALQNQVIKYPFLLYQSVVIQGFAFIFYRLSLKIYKGPIMNYIIIRFGMLMAIIFGYQKSR